MHGRVLLTGHASGPWNLALDEALLETATPDVATLRLYGWRPETISIGVSQPRAAVPEDLRRRYPLARRATGGGALIHDQEDVAFSVAGGAGGDRAPPLAALGAWLAAGVAAVAGETLAVESRIGAPETPAPLRLARAPQESFCLDTAAPLELHAAPAAGSGEASRVAVAAWRRHGNAWLVEGVLALRSPDFGRGAGLLDLAPPPAAAPNPGNDATAAGEGDGDGPAPGLRQRLLDALVEGFAAVGGTPRPVALEIAVPTAAELRRADRLTARRFATRRWLHRR